MNTLALKDMNTYSSFLEHIIDFIPDPKAGNDYNKYQLLKKYLVAFPTNKSQAYYLFKFEKVPEYKNTIFLFFAKRAELLVLSVTKKLDLLSILLETTEKQNILLFMLDTTKKIDDNIGTKLFTPCYYQEYLTPEFNELTK